MVTSAAAPQQLHHARGFVGTQAGHRLVEQQQLRLGGERHRELELALLAVAQLDTRTSARWRARPAPARPRAGSRNRFSLRALPPEAERVPVMRLRRQRDIVERGEIGSSEVIWNERASPSRLRDRPAARVMSRPAKRMRAGIRQQSARSAG
jgi:hypothetical protein